jgi:hypothetical protein
MPNTFGGVWTRPQHDGRGHSRKELADRASYDTAPPAGCSCLLVATVLVTASAAAALRRLR